MRKRKGRNRAKGKERRLFEYSKSLQDNKYVMMCCLSPRLEVSPFLWLLRISKMNQLVAPFRTSEKSPSARFRLPIFLAAFSF